MGTGSRSMKFGRIFVQEVYKHLLRYLNLVIKTKSVYTIVIIILTMELDSDYNIWIIQKNSILDIFLKQANS